MKYRGERDRKSSTVRSSRKASEKLALLARIGLAQKEAAQSSPKGRELGMEGTTPLQEIRASSKIDHSHQVQFLCFIFQAKASHIYRQTYMESIPAKVHNTQHDKRMTLPSQPVLPIILENLYVLYMCLLIPSLSIKESPSPYLWFANLLLNLDQGSARTKKIK